MNIQKILSLTRQGIDAYNMINEGDRIAVGVSGGKDSLTLLEVFSRLQKFYPKSFELMAITCDVGFEGMNFTAVEQLCESLSVKYEIVHTKIAHIAFDKTNDTKPCSLCAKLRKGAMYDRLRELGFNKIAYAHNKDDFIETAFMTLINEGRFYSFPPVSILNGSFNEFNGEVYNGTDKESITVIRPMIYVPEQSIRKYAEDNKLPIVKNKCPVDGATNRAYAKKLVFEIVKDNPGAKDKILNAIENAKLPDWPGKITSFYNGGHQ